MKKFLLLVLASVMFAQTTTRLWNADVIAMVKAHVSEAAIFQAVSTCEPHFLLRPRDTNMLTANGVTDELIKAMAARQAGRIYKPLNR